MTPLERAARALAGDAYDRQHCGLPAEPSKAQFVNVMEASYRSPVRSVLEALREPSESMLDAAAGRFTVEEHFIEADLIVGAGALWQAMIDAALAEGPDA